LAEINKSLRTHTLYTVYEDSENIGLLFKMAVIVFVNSTVLLDIDMFHLLHVAGNKRDSFKSRRTNRSLITGISLLGHDLWIFAVLLQMKI
jgi:hypothetical protein